MTTKKFKLPSNDEVMVLVKSLVHRYSKIIFDDERRAAISLLKKYPDLKSISIPDDLRMESLSKFLSIEGDMVIKYYLDFRNFDLKKKNTQYSISKQKFGVDKGLTTEKNNLLKWLR